MKLVKCLNRLNLTYADPQQEAEYLQIKVPLLKKFLTYMIVCLILLLVPLIIYFFAIVDQPNLGYMTVATLLFAILLFLARNFLGKRLEYVVVLYLLYIVALITINLSKVLFSFKSCESFYGGYAFALIHRILGYRVVNVYSMVALHIISLSLRLTFLNDHGLSVSITMTAVEVVTMWLSFQSEVGERSSFDSLFKSKQQLIKFKDFLTEQLPNQMIIFAKDNSCAQFMNDSFKNTFNCRKISQAQNILNRFILEKESFNQFKKMNILDFEKDTINLSEVLNLLFKSQNFMNGHESMSFQIYESKIIQEGSLIQEMDGYGEERLLSHSTRERRDKSKKNGANKPGLMFQKYGIHIRRKKRACLMHLTKKYEAFKSEIQIKKETSNNKARDIDQDKIEKETKSFRVKISLLPWDGKEAIALIFDEITQEKKIMELQVADRNKDLVIAMVSHELRTPLNGMLGIMDIIKKKVTDTDTEVTSYLNACRNSGLFLLNLVNSILDMSQIKNNKLKLVYSKVRLAELLEEIKSLFESFCTTKNLYLHIVIAQDVPDTIVTDRSRLSQILINLLGNAFKFTFEGGITVRVDKEQNTRRLRFSIQDTGLGIKKEDQEKLFKLFGRLEQEDKSVNTNGVGLGLTISNTLAILLNPSEKQGITVESELEKGSVFSFFIKSEADSPSSNLGLPNQMTSLVFDSSSLEIFNKDSLSLTSKLSSYKTSEAFKFNQIRYPEKDPTLFGHDYSSSLDYSSIFRKHSKHYSCLPTGPVTPVAQKSFVSHKKGSNFTRTSEPGADSRSIIQIEQQGINIQKPWCLIVDDNPFNIIVARHIMEEKGYQIKTALNGKEAIQETQNHYSDEKVFKLALMDCQMPVIDGYEATRLLKAMMVKGEISEFPIIALTANNRDEKHEKLCEESGMNGCISKPLHTGELDNLLKRLQKKII